MPRAAEQLRHSEFRLVDPAGWTLYLSHEQPKRLVVFVHGFGGRAVASWMSFPFGPEASAWWDRADLLFVGYNSARDGITGVSHRLLRELERFYPRPPAELVELDGVRVREPMDEPYRELVVAGHSLGGVIVRHALCESADRWIASGKGTPRPALLEAKVRLFSPASAGFDPSGWLGVARASSTWHALEMVLRRSSAYRDLQAGSQVLTALERRTEELVKRTRLQALRAAVVWAQPDDVVVARRYASDLPDDSIDGKNHRSVCKPSGRYTDPWTFVETGRRR